MCLKYRRNFLIIKTHAKYEPLDKEIPFLGSAHNVLRYSKWTFELLCCPILIPS